MGEISAYVNGPYEGVSQAPPQVRLPGACEAMVDCLPQIPMGVQKRPPFEWQARLEKSGGFFNVVPDVQALWANIPRGSLATDLTLLISREGASPKVYLFQTATWAPLAVTVTPAAQAYLDLHSPLPNQDLRVCSVEDTTFITNRTVTTADTSSHAPTRPYEAIIWCKLSGYARTTVVTVNSVAMGGAYTASFTTGSGSNSNDPLTVGTDKLARALYDGTDPHHGNDTPNPSPLNVLTGFGFTVTLLGSLIYLSHPSTDFTLDIADDIGGTGVIPIKTAVQRFSDLPSVAVDGFTVRVAQEAAGGNSDYFVQFTAGASSSTGTWKEVIAPGAPLGLDPTTMPIGLKLVSGTWTLDALPWRQRLTGDATLSPDPEFIGDQITAIGWWRGRLALVSNGQVNLSASDDPFKFYTSTLAAALDSDPIGLLPPTDIKTFFKEVVIFDQRLVVLGDKGQAVVSATGAVTPTTTKIEPLSKSPFTDMCPTQDVNHKVYFCAPRGKYMAVFELAIDRISGLALPDEMSPAVPAYLPSTLDRAATFQTDFITFRGTSGASAIYLHSFRHSEQQRVQNAWHSWNLPEGWTLCGLYMKDATIYLCLADPSGDALHAFTVDMSPLRTDPGGTIKNYLDLYLPETACTGTSYAGGLTTFTLPFPVTSQIKAALRAPSGPEGAPLVVHSVAGSTVVLQGDHSASHLYFGYSFDSFWTPTRFYKRGQDGTPERAGRLTIQRMKVDVSRFGFLRVEVAIAGRATRSTSFSATDVLDAAPNQEVYTVTVPVGGNNEKTVVTLHADSHLGFAVLGFEWEGLWVPKAGRVT